MMTDSSAYEPRLEALLTSGWSDEPVTLVKLDDGQVLRFSEALISHVCSALKPTSQGVTLTLAPHAFMLADGIVVIEASGTIDG